MRRKPVVTGTGAGTSFAAAVLAFSLAAAAMTVAVDRAAADPGPTGQWLVEKKNGVVDIAACGEQFCGKLIWIDPPARPDGTPPVDDRNKDPTQRHRLICGITMLGGFKAAGPNEWGGGWIYNAENGETYQARMTLLDEGHLKVRGYVGVPLFGESQTWTRATPGLKRCDAGK